MRCLCAEVAIALLRNSLTRLLLALLRLATSPNGDNSTSRVAETLFRAGLPERRSTFTSPHYLSPGVSLLEFGSSREPASLKIQLIHLARSVEKQASRVSNDLPNARSEVAIARRERIYLTL